jgi:signal transduction histidine kinase
MKKLLISLVAAYIGCLGYLYYQKVQTEKIWKDERWRYLLKVVYNSDFKNIKDSYHPKWNRYLTIDVIGEANQQDIVTIEKTAQQISDLIAPLNISVRLHSDKKPFSGSKGFIKIYFLQKGQTFCPGKYLNDTTSAIKFYNSSTTTATNIKRVSQYSPDMVDIYLRADNNNQLKRNGLILKGIVYAVLHHSNQPEREWISTINENGHLTNFLKISNPNFPNSIFNYKCDNCNELTDIDKFIISKFYSDEVNNLIEKRSYFGYFIYFKPLFTSIHTLVYLILINLYLLGFFQKYIFSLFDKLFSNRWLSFNIKIISVFIFYKLLSAITSIAIYHLGKPDGFPSEPYSFHLITVLIFLPYTFIPTNLIYFNEKILFPKFGQFAKQQLFSFIAMVGGTVLGSSLLNLFLFPPRVHYWATICVGAGLGIIRFLYNYSNYEKKLAIIDKEQELNRLRELKTRAELNALQSKINPHFLYNALNSIAGLAHQDADKVERMALSLSRLFRYSINKDDSDFTTVQSEIEMVQLYLGIEKERFGDKLKYTINIAKDVENEQIPKFIVQPLVENAIKHGLTNLTGQGVLTIEITKADNSLVIKVSDNGTDFPEDMMTGYGLQNIYEKLDILYPKRYEVLLQNGENKNITVILMD